jgi:glucosamine--fructose-6-phosphate aminotransferase (isomerizing)
MPLGLITTVKGVTKPGSNFGDKRRQVILYLSRFKKQEVGNKKQELTFVSCCRCCGGGTGVYPVKIKRESEFNMCGIVGYLGSRPAVPILMEGLERLEYRGCDSAGIAVIEDNRLIVTKSAGKLAALKSNLNSNMDNARIGIGHTRWATHGRPSDTNAHPHLDCSGNFAVVHNGIIENYQELRHRLTNAGHRFVSDTDTEVVAHLLEHYYEGDLIQAVLKTLPDLRGSYALAVTSSYHPNELVGVRQNSSLIIGLAEGETYLASNIPAFLPYTRDTYILDDGEISSIKPEGVNVYDADGTLKTNEIFNVNWDL